MPDEITIDGLEEHAFRRSIETMLRHGRADEAADRLKALLPLYAGAGKPLPERLLDIQTSDVRFTGLERIAAKLDEYGRADTPITAVGIGIGDPQDEGLLPDENGLLRPPLQTTYYSDATFPFSETDRDDLLEGYSSYGCEWQGDYDRIDDAIAIEGIDDLYGAIATLENKVGASGNPSSEDICAGAVGACYLGVLVYQAAREAVISHGLPRPLAILLVNSDAYPFFDAPVLTCDEYSDNGAVKVVERAPVMAGESDWDAEDAEDSASLVSMAISSTHVPKKKMVLALDSAEAHNPLGMADELISQAAFDPGSVDLSRFMPQQEFGPEGEDDGEVPPQSDVEARAYAERESSFEERFARPSMFGDAPSDDEDDDAGYADIEFPVDALLPDRDETPVEDHSPTGFEPTQRLAPRDDDDAFAAPEHAGFEPDYREPEPTGQSFGTAPDWATANYLDVEAPAPGERETDFGWDNETEPQPAPCEAPAPVSGPASHSIRSKIRLNQQVEETPSGLAKLFKALAAFVKRVQELLLGR